MNEDTFANHAGAMFIGLLMAAAVCWLPIPVIELMISIFR